jgi:hypothetical protein
MAANNASVARVVNPTLIGSLNIIVDERCLGFLRFITESVNFDIEMKELTINESLRENETGTEDGSYSENETCSQAESYPWKFARRSIISAIGETTASVWVPEAWLAAHESGHREFLLPSACIKGDEIETCQRILRRDPQQFGSNYFRRHLAYRQP